MFEDVEKRTEWFFFQRAYPFESIPPDARRRAWEARPAALSASGKSWLSTVALGWRSIGPTPTTSSVPDNWGVTSGRITSIAISPVNPQLILVGSAAGGIWRSTDGGMSFVPVADDQVDLAVGSIAFSKQNPAMVYAGMGDLKGYLGTGVLKSTDEGQTWEHVNNTSLPAMGLTAKIDVDLLNPRRVYLAQYALNASDGRLRASAFYLSTDGGITWSRKLVGLARDLALHPTDSQMLYLATARVDGSGAGPAGLYRSTNRGETWQSIYATPYDDNRTSDVKVAISPANPQTIYVYTGGLIGSTFDIRVVVSTDGGATWANRGAANLDTGQFGYNTYIAVDPTNPNTIYVGTRDVFKSTNGGRSYVNLTNNMTLANGQLQFTPGRSNTHIDQHVLTFSPINPNVIYVGNDGGLSRSTNGGMTYASLNMSLSLTQLYGIALHPTNPGLSYGGTQDNGLQKRLPGPNQWREFITGDYKTAVVNPLDPSVIVSNYVQGTIFRFRRNGDQFDAQVGSNETFDEPDSRPRIAFLAPLVGNGLNATLYFGTWRLFVSPNFGDTWDAPAGALDLTKGNTDVLTAIGIGKANTNVIYTGSSQGRAMVSRDGGKTWTDITSGLPNRFITNITVDDTNPAVAYLTVSGYRSGHVFKTTNTGATWTDISGNLPDAPANALVIDPLDPNMIYVGTDIGVFRSAMSGGTWFTFNEGIPPVVVTAFTANRRGDVQAATFGRGAYELQR
jgi:photosystem II stability/assembly factor-like uncharacterized protein